ncbi:hypothetical protein RA264_27625, partial [Pseudomonas syringae pv. tagetis]|uniref:hypothetical protein n=1 Tax=Pseudomonas syringae group genomosp. 7 TaxID=251699 RepID=UPI00376FB44F
MCVVGGVVGGVGCGGGFLDGGGVGGGFGVVVGIVGRLLLGGVLFFLWVDFLVWIVDFFGPSLAILCVCMWWLS